MVHLPRSTFGWRKAVAGCAAAAAAAALASCGGVSTTTADGTPILNWYIYNPGAPIFDDAAAKCSQQSNGAYEIRLNYLPAAADGQRQQMVRRLAAEDSSLDILGLDVTWTAEFAEAGWIAPWAEAEASKVREGTLEAMLETATWDDKLYSAPYNTNTQLLFYRKDLVPKAPKTWDEMISMSEQLAKQDKPNYIEVQGAQYEGYVVWFNTMVASAGGQILNDDSTEAQLGQPAVTALEIMQKLATSAAADPSLSNQMEDQNRLAFEGGKAAFQINYPFVYPSAKENSPDVFKNLAWAPYPRVKPDEPAHVTIGGIDLAVSAYSTHQQEAFDAIQCVRGSDFQITNAIEGGLPPVLTDIYENPTEKFKSEYPFYKDIFTALKQASLRPKTPAYQNVSILIASTLSPPEDIEPEADVDEIGSQVSDALESKGLIP